MDDIFIRYLKFLGVKYTKKYAKELCESNPNKNNLYGLSSLLDKYQVDNEGLLLDRSKSSLSKIDPPFVVEMKDGFGIVLEKDTEKIDLLISKKKKTISYDEFIENWSGVVLISELNEKSGEPNYSENRKASFLEIFEKCLLGALLFLFLLFCGIENGLFTECGLVFSLLLNIMGFCVCWLLIDNQIDSSSGYIDSLCPLFGGGKDCNHILKSDASRLFGYIAWSEIGISFYISNLWLIFCFTNLYAYLSVISVCSLLFTFWSVYYQKYEAKEWCFLCLLVVFSLWLLFVNNLVFGLIRMPDFRYGDLISVLCIYLIPLFSVHLLLPIFMKSSKLEEVSRRFKQLKSDEDIFRSLLKSSRKYVIDKRLGISWGDFESKNTITVISNPYCKSCGEMHSNLKAMMMNARVKYNIQYIFVTYNQTLEKSIALFMAMNQSLNSSKFDAFLDDWFSSDDKKRQDIMNGKYLFDINDECWWKNIKDQKNFAKFVDVKATPTLFFNGYLLPSKYDVEDLVEFCDVDVDVD